jgi:hypothetical protein
MSRTRKESEIWQDLHVQAIPFHKMIMNIVE